MFFTVLCATMLASAGSPAPAAVPAPAPRFVPVIGAHIGPAFSHSPLQPFALPALELGVQLPFLGGRLETFLMAAYTRPSVRGSGQDPHLSTGAWTYELTQEQLLLGLGVSYRLWGPAHRWTPYVGAGPQLLLEQAVTNGAQSGTPTGTADAGSTPLGENREQFTRVGLMAQAGAEWTLGPGAAFLQIDLSWSRFDGVVTGQSANPAITPGIGYRLKL